VPFHDGTDTAFYVCRRHQRYESVVWGLAGGAESDWLLEPAYRLAEGMSYLERARHSQAYLRLSEAAASVAFLPTMGPG
jgi:hypothetical protein